VTATSLSRSRTEVDAARLLATSGFHAQAVSRAYYAAFYAAEAALMVVGVSRSKHSGVLSAVGRQLVRDGDLPADVGRTLHTLFDLRNAVDDAERVVSAVGEWFGRQPPSR
jgi:uncharacterized protein (UPF0332 family)